jgi:hypothetical protein
MLSALEAAEYCRLPAKRFSVVCSVQPVRYSDGTKVFDMRDLDLWIEGLKVGAQDDDEIIARLF